VRSLAALGLVACGASSATVTPPPPHRAPPPDEVDLVSPLSAAGIEHPQGMDWGPTGDKPASQIFKNVKLMGDLTSNRMMTGMQSMKASLGVGCDHCHDTEAYPADTKKPKATARTMLTMAHDLNTRFFGGKTFVSCYTCHREEAKPAAFQPTRPAPEWPMRPLAAADAQRPAKEIYKNLKLLGDVPAGRMPALMGLFSAALGTGCIHCHDTTDWASDGKPAKRRAREMLAMVHDLGDTYFAGGENPVRCGTCHRGSVTPARSVGPLVVVDATLAGGAAAPQARLVLGPPSLAIATRGELRALFADDEKAKMLTAVAMYQATQAELGHVAPGSYSLCAMALPKDADPAKDPRGPGRPVFCAPLTVTPEPDTQRITRALPPL